MIHKAAITVLALTLVLLQAPLHSQDEPIKLTVEQALELALEQSYDARVQQLTLIQAEQRVKASKGRFRTRINMRLNAPNFAESVSSQRLPDQNPYYNTTGSIRWQNWLTITQPLPTDGTISLRSNLYQSRESVYRDQLEITDKDKRFYTSLTLSLNQPLFVPNNLKLSLERANLNHEQAQRNYTRSQLDVTYNVTEAFYSLYRARRNLEIASEEVEQLEGSFTLAQRKYDAGLIPEVDALQIEVDLAQSRNDLFTAEGNLSQQADVFKMTVGLPLEESVDVTTDLTINNFTVDEQKAVDHGLRHRSEIRDREIRRRLAEITLKEIDARSAIEGNISAYYDLTGVSDPMLDYGSTVSRFFRSSIEDLKRRPKNRGVTFSLSLPIWDSGVNRSEVAAARAALEVTGLNEQEERRKVTQRIRLVISRLKETRNRLDVLQRSEEVARRGFEITQQRFNNGDITSQDLALNRERLTAARQNYLSAFIDYQLAVADLKRNTLYDWEQGRSLVEEAG